MKVALIETHLFSEVLGMEMEAYVIYPQEKQPYSGDGKLKVLWLLHGGSGDATAWLRMSSIARYAEEYGIVVVLPGAMNSCFTDMEHGGRFFAYVADELPGVLRHLLPRLSADREENYIAGYSNGGYGCFKIGLSRPDRYAAIGAFSAGDKSDIAFVNDGSSKARERILLFGEESLLITNHDLKHLAREALRRGGPLPRVYHACGSLDPWLDLNVRMRDFFMGLEGDPYRYQYHEAEGHGHTWEFWDREILRFFDYLALQKTEGRYTAGM